MITAKVMSAGNGYTYYLENIANQDMQAQPGQALADYYGQEGNTPGRWYGGGAAQLGVSGEVTEAQMRALLGEGLHPDADAITERMLAEGASEAEIAKAIKLGRAYYKYDVKDSALRQAVEYQIDEFTRTMGRTPDRSEARAIRMKEGAIAFRDAYGRAPLNTAELSKYVGGAMKATQHAVSYFDLTMTVPKSVSLAMMLGDDSTTAKIQNAMEKAFADTVKWLEREAAATRGGVNGVEQIALTGGLIIQRFDHLESRTGDPHPHFHILVANKGLGVDGKWRTLDSNLLLRMVKAASAHNNRRLFDHLTDAGFTATERVSGSGKSVVMELVGVPGKLIDRFSGRNRDVRAAVDTLTDAYVRDHGHAPDRAAAGAIDAQAWRETRPDKATPRSLRQIKQDLQSFARENAPDDAHATVELTEQLEFKQAQQQERIEISDAAGEIMRALEKERSTWRYNHVVTKTNDYLNHHRYATLTHDGIPVDTDTAYKLLLQTALGTEAIKVTPPPAHGAFQPLQQLLGDTPVGSKATVYTSTRILDAEHRLLSAARTQHTLPAPVTEAQFQAALAKNPNKDLAQVAFAHHLVTGQTQLRVGVGPAGAGKTRSVKLAAAAVQEAGGRLLGLAPSKAAAKVFARDVGVPAFTVDGLLTAHREAAKAGVDVSEKYTIHAGDVVVIDEAFMGATALLDEATQLILSHGGYVGFVGDYAQLSAPGAGDVARLIAKDVGAIELENIYRFTNHEEREASKSLRESAPGVDPFAWYKANGRIIAATRDTLIDVIFNNYLRDLDAGWESVMGAPTRAYVDELNARAQTHHMATGTVTGKRPARLSDGHRAYVGDRVLTRKNTAELKMNGGRDQVDNGDLYTVTGVHRDGSLDVEHLHHGGTITLPAAYVKEHTELGYAFTSHGLQGDTIGGKGADGLWVKGAARGIVTADTTRADAYVEATRGTDLNVLYVDVPEGGHPDQVLEQVARNLDTNLSAHEMIQVEHDRIHNLSSLVGEHQNLVARADQQRFTFLAHNILGTHAPSFLASEAWDAVAAGLARAERHGLNPAEVLHTAFTERDWDKAEDLAAVLSYRIEKNLDDGLEEGTVTPLSAPGTDTGVYEWAVNRTTQNDPNLPEEWRTELGERAAYIDQLMTLRGAELAAEQPAWTSALGPVPERADRQKRWMRLAAEIDLFRTRYNIDPTTTDPIPVSMRNEDLGKTLTARATALHKSTALTRARGNTATLNPDIHERRVTTLRDTIATAQAPSQAEVYANTIDPDRADRQRARTIEQLRADLTRIADNQTTIDPITQRLDDQYGHTPDILDRPGTETDTHQVDEQVAATRRAETTRQLEHTIEADRRLDDMNTGGDRGYDWDELTALDTTGYDDGWDDHYDSIDAQTARSRTTETADLGTTTGRTNEPDTLTDDGAWADEGSYDSVDAQTERSRIAETGTAEIGGLEL